MIAADGRALPVEHWDTSEPAARERRDPARLRVHRGQVVEVARRRAVELRERALDHVRDPEERQAALQEGGHGHLVRSVERAGRRVAGLPRGAGEREAGERLQVRRAELQDHPGGEVERLDGRRGTLRVRQRVGDRHAHVGVAEMRQRGAVPEAHHGVHDGGRVDDDLDPVVREVEEEVRLDQLEPLVHERRRVDRDLRAHAPGRMRERVGRLDVGEVGAAAAAEGPARGRENEGVDGLRGVAVEKLERGGVLGVHGEQPPSSPLPGRHGQVAARDQALLVRKREVDAPLQRPEGRREAGEAHDRVEDDVGLGAVEQVGRIASHLGQRREAVDRGRARGGRDELQPRVAVDDLARLAPDRACRAQEGDALHPQSV